jgi:hypothetical protein
MGNMDRSGDFGPYAANRSGAPEAGGAVSAGSRFGGDTLQAHVLRFVARIARSVEATCYRRLRDLDLEQFGDPRGRPGAPNRVRSAARPN